jgi:thiol-disulfide isomerase/thioredoxin
MGQSNMNFAAGSGVVVALLLLGFAAVPRMLGRVIDGGGRSGQPAPDFTVELVANAAEAEDASASSGDAGSPEPSGPLAPRRSQMTLSHLRGKAVVLDFWATWCPPCKAEAPILNGIAKRYRGRDVVVVGVNTDDAEGNAARFAASKALTYPIAYDADKSAAAAYGVSALPTLVVVSRTGKIIAVRTGLTSDADIDALIREALAS